MIEKQRGFISGSALVLLLCSLIVSTSLVRGLHQAARAAREDLIAIRAALAFEDAMIRLDQGKAFPPFQEATFRVTAQREAGLWRLRLWDHERIREELCLSAGDS